MPITVGKKSKLSLIIFDIENLKCACETLKLWDDITVLKLVILNKSIH